MNSISVPLVFLAGLLSFLSPCVLPLVPIYMSYLSGSSISGDTSSNRWHVLSHALFFVGGFTLIFVVLFGLPTTILGSAFQQYRDWVTRIGGVILVLFGLHTMGVITISILNMTRRVDVGSGMNQGYARSALLGLTFAAGWTPCIGPLLGTVMTLAFAEPSRALVFIFIYAMGLAIPFLVAAGLLARATGWLKRLNQHMRAVEITSGLLMVGVGVLLITGTFSVLNNYFIRITPEWLMRFL
ncbi:MAG: cytochrome c biogenesis CcdA family protein [Anaerolineae bacterium]